MLLSGSSQTIQMITSTSALTEWNIEYVDYTPTISFLPNSAFGMVSSSTTSTILSAPASGTIRKIKNIIITNDSTSSQQQLKLVKDVSGVGYSLTNTITLRPLEMLNIDQNDDIQIYDSLGRQKSTTSDVNNSSQTVYQIRKVGGTMEAAGVGYSYQAIAGFPGAWNTGSVGLSGKTVSGSGETGLISIPNSSSLYLTEVNGNATAVNQLELIDILWYNSGSSVTQTTAQTVNSVPFAARDINGTNLGQGVNVGIYVTIPTVNGTPVTTIRMAYTNSAGTTGRTATIPSFPATAVAGTLVPFSLQAGDNGVRGVTSLTLGTTLGSGSISLIAYKPISQIPCNVANMNFVQKFSEPGYKLFGDEALTAWIPQAVATTATTIYLNAVVKNYTG